MPTSARTSLGFFGQFADVGIRAPEQNGLLQQALVRACPKCRVAESLSESFVGHFVELAHFRRNFDKVFRQRLTTKFGNESFGTSSSWSRRPSLHPARKKPQKIAEPIQIHDDLLIRKLIGCAQGAHAAF